MLPHEKSRASQTTSVAITGVDHSHPPRSDARTGAGRESGVGFELQLGEGQSFGGLDRGNGVGIHSLQPPALQPDARSRLSQYRLHALHPSRDARRACPRGPVARLSKDLIWSTPTTYLTAPFRCAPNATLQTPRLRHPPFTFRRT